MVHIVKPREPHRSVYGLSTFCLRSVYVPVTLRLRSVYVSPILSFIPVSNSLRSSEASECLFVVLSNPKARVSVALRLRSVSAECIFAIVNVSSPQRASHCGLRAQESVPLRSRSSRLRRSLEKYTSTNTSRSLTAVSRHPDLGLDAWIVFPRCFVASRRDQTKRDGIEEIKVMCKTSVSEWDPTNNIGSNNPWRNNATMMSAATMIR